MTDLVIDASIEPAISSSQGTTTVTFTLASGNTSRPFDARPIPAQEFLLNSSPVDFTSSINSSQQVQEIIPFDFNLEPGTDYWLIQDGTGSAQVDLSEEYAAASEQSTVPEPSSIYLMLLGVAGALLSRKLCLSHFS